MSHGPRVSVVLPTFNRRREIARAIGSVLNQTYTDFELLVVDDGSSDDTVAVVREFGDPRIRYLRHDHNRGGAAARNTGIEECRGAFVAFQDSDDRWLPEKLARQMARLEEAPPSIGLNYCAYWRVHANGRRRYSPPRHIHPRSGNIHRALLRESFIGTPALILRRSCLVRTGGFDETLRRLQDWELLIRVTAEWEADYLDEPLVEAHFAGTNITAGHDEALVAAERRILQKHREVFRTAGNEVLAYRCWHLAHLLCMTGRTEPGRELIDEALQLDPRLRYRLFRLLSRTGAGYRAAYRLYCALLRH